MVVLHLDFSPEGLAVIVVDGVDQVQDDLALRLPVGAGSDGREGILMDSDPLGGGEPGLDAVILQCNFVVSRFSLFAVVGEAAAESAVRVVRGARIQLQRACGRHN